ncbi:MAG TPA: ATP synthase F1 subunit delta [Candidatus Obscuribacterales bacterium]
MKLTAVSERYAEALFSMAQEQRQEARFGGILDDIEALAQDHPDFLRMLQHPVIKRQDKKQLLEELFASSIPKELLNFLKLLVDKKRENYLREIIASYKGLLDAHNQTVLTEVITATPMQKKTQEILKQNLESYLGQQVVMQCDTNPELLGGVMIKIGDRLIDGSLRTRLNEMAQVLVAKS